MRPRVVIRGKGELDEKTRSDLLELQRLAEQNPLEVYFPYPYQEEFHAGQTRVKGLIAANRVGKTQSLVIDCLLQALPMELVPEHLRRFKKWGLPGDIPFRGRVLTPGLSRTMDAAILDKFREWGPAAGFVGGSFKKAFSKQDRVLRFVGGGWIDFFSYEQDLQAHAGVALHRVAYDEEPPGEKGWGIRNESVARLTDFGGEELFSLTPLLGYSHVKEEIYDRRDKDPEVMIVTASMYDAPHIPQEEIERLKEIFSEEQFRARVLGEFVHFGGLVYKEWDADRHLVDPPSKKHVQGLDIVIGIDPGIRTTGVVFCGFDEENTMLVFDELYLHDEATIPENAAQAIRERLRYWGTKEKSLEPRWVLIDPSARNRNLVTGEDVQGAYMRCGINAIEGMVSREAGVFELKRRMQAVSPQMLYVSKECPWWRYECEKYRIKEKEDGTFDVVKEDDHLLDATRWVAMSRPVPIVRKTENKHADWWRPGYAPPFKGHGPSTNVSSHGALA